MDSYLTEVKSVIKEAQADAVSNAVAFVTAHERFASLGLNADNAKVLTDLFEEFKNTLSSKNKPSGLNLGGTAMNTTTATATTTQQESVPVAPASSVPPDTEVPPCTAFISQMDESNRIATEIWSTQGEAKFMEHIFSETMPDGSKRGLTYAEMRERYDCNVRDAPASSVPPSTDVPPCTAFISQMDEPNRIATEIWSTQGSAKFMEHVFSETMPDGSKRGLTYAEMRERYG
jgi:hypothetical protein